MAQEYVVTSVSAEALAATPSKAAVTTVVAEVLRSVSAYITRPIPKRRKTLQHIN